MTDHLGRLGAVTGRAGQVSVTLTDLSFRATSDGRQYPYPDFGSDFIDALHKALLAPRRQGLLRSRVLCPSCEASLEDVKVGRIHVTTEVALAKIPPIRVDLDMPGLRCPRCNEPLVLVNDRAIDSDLSDALIDGFAVASLTPG